MLLFLTHTSSYVHQGFSLYLSLLVALIIAVACAFGDPVVLHIHVLSPTALLDSFIHPNFEMENQVYCLMLHFWEEEEEDDDDHTTTTRESTVSLLNQVRVCSRARLAQDNDDNYNEERIKCINNLGQRIATGVWKRQCNHPEGFRGGGMNQ